MERAGRTLVVRAWPGTEADRGGGLLGATRDARWKSLGSREARPPFGYAGENRHSQETGGESRNGSFLLPGHPRARFRQGLFPPQAWREWGASVARSGKWEA